MSQITSIEQEMLFDFFDIENGFILYRWTNGNKTKARNLIYDATHIDIFKDNDYTTLSQQKCIEKLIREQPNYIIAKLFGQMLNYIAYHEPNDDFLNFEYLGKKRIIEVLIGDLRTRKDNPYFWQTLPTDVTKQQALYSEINNLLENNEYALAIDRVHTYTGYFLTELCNNNIICPNADKNGYPMFDDMITQLVSHYKNAGLIDESIEPILTQGKSIFQKFNSFRNKKSYAHANKVSDEITAEFYLGNILCCLKYLGTIDEKARKQKQMTVSNKEQTQC